MKLIIAAAVALAFVGSVLVATAPTVQASCPDIFYSKQVYYNTAGYSFNNISVNATPSGGTWVFERDGSVVQTSASKTYNDMNFRPVGTEYKVYAQGCEADALTFYVVPSPNGPVSIITRY